MVSEDNGKVGLDTKFPYQASRLELFVDETKTTTFVDTPHLPVADALGNKTIGALAKGDFSTYLMFRPPGPDAFTEWVPLRIITWHFRANGDKIAGQWKFALERDKTEGVYPPELLLGTGQNAPATRAYPEWQRLLVRKGLIPAP
jgi:hypothetical protein